MYSSPPYSSHQSREDFIHYDCISSNFVDGFYKLHVILGNNKDKLYIIIIYRIFMDFSLFWRYPSNRGCF